MIFPDYMWLHIRAVGQWTNRLYAYFETEQEKLHNGGINPLQPCSSKPTNDNPEANNQNALSQIKATITRTLSRKEKDSNGNKKSGVQLVGYSNENFENTEEPQSPESDASYTVRSINNTSGNEQVIDTIYIIL